MSVAHTRRCTALLSVLTLVVVVLTGASTRLDGAERRDAQFPALAPTPYPMQHVNPRAADYVEAEAPTSVVPAWRALSDSMIAQPCSSGPNGDVYCTRAWAHPTTDKCNLVALDGKSGAVLWEDRVHGKCLLDEYAWITNPTIDRDGNLYVADSKLVASFTANGKLRWLNRTPSRLTSVRGLPNTPFGLNFLPTGELVTATMGDAHILVFDRTTGKLLSKPFHLPSDKQRASTSGQAPPGFMESLASPGVGSVLYDVGLGVSDKQVDNNVAVDPRSGLVFVTGGAPDPNPGNDGALWAVRYDRRTHTSRVQFLVRFPGPGGIATTPTVTKDGNYVLIGDNQNNFVAVDIPACAKGAVGSTCTDFASTPVGGKLGASVTVSPDDRVYFPIATQGLFAYDIKRDNGTVTLTHVFTKTIPGAIFSTVLTGFENAIWFGTSTGGEHALVAVDPKNGDTLSTQPACDLANVTMGSDGRTLYTNCINFQDELGGRHVPAGLQAWRPS
jgi:outer membrane protein assembly factor BamB